MTMTQHAAPAWVGRLAVILIGFAALVAANPPAARAADDVRIAAVEAADDARMRAMEAADRGALEAIFSDDLRYAHSNGLVDTKASLIDTILAGKTRYRSFAWKDRHVTLPAPGIALVAGRVRIRATTADNEIDSDFSVLGVWREEQGRWRFIAWQSCRLPPPAP